MEKNIADVSIVVANYNNGEYLPKFLSSVLESTLLPKELIIVDDGSSDDSVSKLDAAASAQGFIKVIKFPKNQGFANALNEGLQVATGKYIMRVDPDDYIAPNRIRKQYEFLESHPETDIAGSNITYFDSTSGQVVFNSNVPLNSNDILQAFREGNCGIIHGSMMCKSSVIRQFKYDQKNVPAEDYELFSLMLKAGHKPANLPDSLTFVRVHLNSVSNNLPFGTIRKTFDLKEKIWGTKTSHLKVKRIHLYLFYYRKFLFNKGLEKYIYLFLAALFNPMKAFARITAAR
jgi:glycosyltransferase involved in cell wall biosynthesis